jgi:hypothetical protein
MSARSADEFLQVSCSKCGVEVGGQKLVVTTLADPSSVQCFPLCRGTFDPGHMPSEFGGRIFKPKYGSLPFGKHCSKCAKSSRCYTCSKAAWEKMTIEQMLKWHQDTYEEKCKEITDEINRLASLPP